MRDEERLRREQQSGGVRRRRAGPAPGEHYDDADKRRERERHRELRQPQRSFGPREGLTIRGPEPERVAELPRPPTEDPSHIVGTPGMVAVSPWLADAAPRSNVESASLKFSDRRIHVNSSIVWKLPAVRNRSANTTRTMPRVQARRRHRSWSTSTASRDGGGPLSDGAAICSV